jgi:murein DD-endopeptidase MepM/ murein hydrolase activator NlpD
VAIATAVLLTLGVAASPLAHAEDHLKHKQKQVKKQISAAHHDLDESSSALRTATIKLRSARTQLNSARVKLATTREQLHVAQVQDAKMQVKLDEAVAALATAREELAQGQEDVQTQKVAVGQMAADIYEMGDPRMLSFANILDAQDPGEMTRSESVTDAVVDQENGTLDDLTAAKVLLTVREGNVEKKKDNVAVARKDAAENLQLMETLEQQAVDQKKSVRALVVKRATAQAHAARIKRHDARQLAHLQHQQNRIAAALRKRALALAARNHRKLGAPTSAGGYLMHPVTGPVTSPYGYRVHPIYGYYSLHDGVDFGAGCGQPLYSAASGRVMQSYFSSVWGNRMIIDNGYARGVGLGTIYNHATRYIVGVGQTVKRGQVIGYVGTTGWSTGCHLHFTVMVNGRPTNPMSWF